MKIAQLTTARPDYRKERRGISRGNGNLVSLSQRISQGRGSRILARRRCGAAGSGGAGDLPLGAGPSERGRLPLFYKAHGVQLAMDMAMPRGSHGPAPPRGRGRGRRGVGAWVHATFGGGDRKALIAWAMRSPWSPSRAASVGARGGEARGLSKRDGWARGAVMERREVSWEREVGEREERRRVVADSRLRRRKDECGE